VVEVIQASYIVAGDVAGFDVAAFKASLAAHLPGVTETDISVEVTAASVKVTATILPPAAQPSGATLAALTALASNTSVASSTLGVTVEAASAPVKTRAMVAPPPPPAGLTPGHLIGIIVAAGSVGLCFAILLVCIFGRRDRKKRLKETNGVVYRDSRVPPPPPDEASQPFRGTRTGGSWKGAQQPVLMVTHTGMSGSGNETVRLPPAARGSMPPSAPPRSMMVCEKI